MLRGARLVTANETEAGRAWAEALTGGDPISARFMRHDFFTFRPQLKLLFAGNHQPSLQAVDPAMRRRFDVLSFIYKPMQPDQTLEERLKEEAPRILAWAMQGCLDRKTDGIGRPESAVEATDEYFEEQDIFGRCLQDCCEFRASWLLPLLCTGWDDQEFHDALTSQHVVSVI